MSKSSVSKNYMNRQKALHNHKSILAARAIVFGSDGFSNIGFNIAHALSTRGIEAVEFDKEQCNLNLAYDRSQAFYKDHWYDTAIFCNGRTNLDWIEDQPLAEVLEVINDSLTASILGAQEFIQSTMHKEYRKSIVFVGSMAYKSVLNGSSIYCAAKAGLAQFAKCLAWELAPKGFDVYCVHPSNTVGTPMTQQTIEQLARYRGLTIEEATSYWGDSLPRNSFLTPGEIGKLVADLVEGKFQYLAGSNIELAGGLR